MEKSAVQGLGNPSHFEEEISDVVQNLNEMVQQVDSAITKKLWNTSRVPKMLTLSSGESDEKSNMQRSKAAAYEPFPGHGTQVFDDESVKESTTTNISRADAPETTKFIPLLVPAAVGVVNLLPTAIQIAGQYLNTSDHNMKKDKNQADNEPQPRHLIPPVQPKPATPSHVNVPENPQGSIKQQLPAGNEVPAGYPQGPNYRVPVGYLQDPNYGIPAGYPQRPFYGAPAGYPQGPNYGAPVGYPQGPNYGAPVGYPQGPNYGAPVGYPQGPNYGFPAGYPQRPNYGAPVGYPQGPNYGVPAEYPQGPNYRVPVGYLQDPNYGIPAGYPQRPFYGAPAGYPQGPNYGAPVGYPQGPNYGVPAGYPQGSYYGVPAGYSQGPNYGVPTGYLQRPNYGAPAEYPQGPNYGFPAVYPQGPRVTWSQNLSRSQSSSHNSTRSVPGFSPSEIGITDLKKPLDKKTFDQKKEFTANIVYCPTESNS